MLRMSRGVTALFVLAAASLPLTAASIVTPAQAQAPQKKAPPKAAAKPAPKAAPRPAPRAAAPRPAPRAAAPRAAPRPAPRATAPRAAPRPHIQRAAPARPQPQRQAAPPRRQPSAAAARPKPQAPAAAAAPKQQPPKAAAKQAPPAASPAQQRAQERTQRRQEQRQERTQRAQENRELRKLPPAQRAQRREDIRNAREERAKARATQRDQAKQPAQNAQGANDNTPAARAERAARDRDARKALTPEQRRAERTERLRERRDERAQRRREDRELRALPAAERTKRRDEIRNAREERAQQRRQAREDRLQRQNAGDAAARTNALTDRNRAAAQERRATRRNGQARVSRQAARQGRFAASLQAQAAMASANRDARIHRARAERWAARRAWRQGLRAAFVPWYGPVFWPYAYSDIFYYSFWPGGYDDGYWYYAYDDFIDGLFWGEVGPPVDYVYADPPPARSRASAAPRVTYAAVQNVCKQPGSGVTAWPFAEIERIGLNAEQKKLLGDVREAAKDSAAAFKETCPSDTAFPLTPPGRLGIMTARLDATLEAVRGVRPALEAFYDSLSDEQKARFNRIGPKGDNNNDEVRKAAAETGKSCAEPKPGLANLPIEEIEDTVKPTEEQEASLRTLEDATVKAVSILQDACPQDVPQTPTGRLELMEKRLQAMRDAANEVKPALTDFYAALSNEQKARFNTIGQTLAQADDNDE